MYIVFVGSAFCAEAGMHFLCNRIYIVYRNCFWKNGIHFVDEVLPCRELTLKVEVGNVVSGVYAGVCPACTYNLNRLFKEYRKGPLEFSLHAVGIFLNLPAAEMGSIV